MSSTTQLISLNVEDILDNPADAAPNLFARGNDLSGWQNESIAGIWSCKKKIYDIHGMICLPGPRNPLWEYGPAN